MGNPLPWPESALVRAMTKMPLFPFFWPYREDFIRILEIEDIQTLLTFLMACVIA